MTALSPNSLAKSSGLISAQDLLGLMKSTGKSAFLRMKSHSSIMRTSKWKQRFVILANNEIYVYADEMSKRPVSCLPLLGCNQIKRYESEKYPWSFAIIGAVISINPRVFSCTTEEERKTWMWKIKEHMYKANNVEPPLTDALNSLACGTKEEYIDLEEPIFVPDDPVGLEIEEEDGEEISGEEKTSEEDDASGQSLPRDRKSSTGSHGKKVALIPNFSAFRPRNTKVIAELGKQFRQFRNGKEEEEESEEEKGQEYEEYGGEEEEEESTQIEMLSKLERCLITDPLLERDREACKALLQDKSRLGVYLLRKSRQGDSLVLAVLTDNTDVKEYRLEEQNGLYRLQSKAEFLPIDDLLTFFSNDSFIPGMNHFLTFGIFECPDDTYADMV